MGGDRGGGEKDGSEKAVTRAVEPIFARRRLRLTGLACAARLPSTGRRWAKALAILAGGGRKRDPAWSACAARNRYYADEAAWGTLYLAPSLLPELID